MIPLCDLQRQYSNLKAELDQALLEVAASGQYILGSKVRDFEQEFAVHCGTRFAVGVGSGTAALHIALWSLGIGPSDEVVTTPFTFVATSEAIALLGAKPVFVDIDPSTYNINPALIEAAITPRTRAILPVHLYGQPCEMAKIKSIASKYDLRVVEDCAQATGARYEESRVGSLGDVGCFSFFPSKNLGAFGDGGMITINCPRIYERAEKLRRHGGKVKYHHTELGMNSRLDSPQAAVLSVKIQYLEGWNEARRAVAYRYNELLSDCTAVTLPRELSGTDRQVHVPRADHDATSSHISAVYQQYTILVENRDQTAESLQQQGIGTAVYYPVPLHLQEVHAPLHFARGSFPVAEYVANHCLSLPMFPEMTAAQQEAVVSRLVPLVGNTKAA